MSERPGAEHVLLLYAGGREAKMRGLPVDAVPCSWPLRIDPAAPLAGRSPNRVVRPAARACGAATCLTATGEDDGVPA